MKFSISDLQVAVITRRLSSNRSNRSTYERCKLCMFHVAEKAAAAEAQ